MQAAASTETRSPAPVFLSLLSLFVVLADAAASPEFPSTWPQAYSVRSDRAAQLLALSTKYYTVEHDLKRGGAIQLIRLTHGRAANLLLQPIETRVVDQAGTVFSDLNDRAPQVHHSTEGLTEVVAVESRLKDQNGREARGLRLKTRFEYHWGYIKVRKEIVSAEPSFRAQEVCPFSTLLSASLTDYGYREGATEPEGAPPFSFGSCRWGKLRNDVPGDKSVRTTLLPRYLLVANPGVEGLEWFAGSDLYEWDLQLAGRRGQGQFVLEPSRDPAGLTLSISPFRGDAGVALTNSAGFGFYLGLPLLDGHARGPWFHASFNRNRGEWVSPGQLQDWAQSGIQTVHCHNDGDYYEDGLFWRDGAYPPYPDMERYDKVIRDCHSLGIRVATYFSNKELHPSTREYQQHGLDWARKSLKGQLQHNFFRGTNEFGAQMCLRSGWLDFLKLSIDRVLARHALDGVYYDWNVALLCCNALHADRGDANASAHWDIDELLQLMEWTRRRVGPGGLVILHNTTTPMLATENFADHIVANEWGYGKWSGNGPELKDLPLEWSLVGARSRGVISYGQLDANSPRRLHRVFALEALLAGVTPWPASQETFQIFPILKHIGRLDTCQFLDWQNDAVRLQGKRCASAIYSRPGETYLLIANLSDKEEEVHCGLLGQKLPHPLVSPTAAQLVSGPQSSLDVVALFGKGLPVRVAADSAVLIKVW